MSDERMKKYGSPMGSAHMESNPMGTSDESPQHFMPGSDRPTSTGLSGSRVVCVYVTCSLTYQMMLHLDESFNQVSLSHLNKMSLFNIVPILL